MTALQRAWRGGKNDWRLHVLSIFSVAVAFVCLASTLLVVVNVDALRTRWASVGRASVYLELGTPEPQVRQIEQALRSSPGVTKVRYVSAEDARSQLLTSNDDQVLSALPSSAFPASLEVDYEGGGDRLGGFGAKIQNLPAVESVETYQSWTRQLTSMLTGGVSAAALLALVVLGAVVSVVGSTMRMALERRKSEVEVLKLVGATDSYVRQPFVVEGAAQGAIGATLAVMLVAMLYGIVRSNLDASFVTLLGLDLRFLPLGAMVLLVSMGAAMGALAAWGSLRRLLVV